MDKCKEIQDLILTDYMDGQMEGSSKLKLEQHFLICPSCQAFAKEVKEQLQIPFENAKRQEVPFQLWASIKEKIQEQEHKQSVWENFLEGLRGMTLPKLVPMAVSFSLILFVSSTVFFDQQIKEANDQENGAYITYVLASSTTTGETNNDLGTPIEKYFL